MSESDARRAPSDVRPPGAGTLVFAAALVFLSSLFVMTLELTASRLVAQYLGVSLYTWTAVIGVVLAGITAGNYVGGKLADLYPPRSLLTALFLLASVTCLSVLFLVDWMGTWQRPESLSWPLWILRNIAITFLLPSAVLGTISPVAARMGVSGREQIGSALGTVYAAGAAGSIVGTFLTGYVLVDMFGSKAIVCGVAAGLEVIGLVVGLTLRRSPHPFFIAWLFVVAVVSALTVGPWPWSREIGVFVGLRFDNGNMYFQEESSYFAIEIYDAEELDDTRILALDHLVHSYVAMDDPRRLEYAYETVYASITHRIAEQRAPLRTFFIGGGGFTFPRWIEDVYPAATIDVAEIDPEVKRAAQVALGLPPDDLTRIRTHTLDARNYLDDLRRGPIEPEGRFDLVYGDAFNDLGVPFHLTTRGFNERLRQVLAPDGAYLVNVIDVYREGYGRFLGAYVTTARETFPCVYVFSGEPDGISEDRDTFVVVSSGVPLDLQELGKRPDDLPSEGSLIAWTENGVDGGDMATLLRRGGGLVLTDDHAPVDNLLAPIFSLQEDS